MILSVVDMGFPGGTVLKNLAAKAGDTGSSSLGQEDPPEEEMTTCSSLLAGKIPCRKEPGRLQSMGSRYWATEPNTCAGENDSDTQQCCSVLASPCRKLRARLPLSFMKKEIRNHQGEVRHPGSRGAWPLNLKN